MFDEESICLEMRSRIADACVVDLATQFAGDNETPVQSDSGVQFWIQENVVGGDYKVLSDTRKADETLTVQYTLFVPCGSGISVLREKKRMIEEEFSVMGEKAVVKGNGCIGTVKSIVSRAGYEQEPPWCYTALVLSVRVSGC